MYQPHNSMASSHVSLCSAFKLAKIGRAVRTPSHRIGKSGADDRFTESSFSSKRASSRPLEIADR